MNNNALAGVYPLAGHRGLTKREYFAGLALQGLLSAVKDLDAMPEDLESMAVLEADALLDELAKEREE